MATAVPGSLFAIVAAGLNDTDGVPLSGGFIYSYIAGTTTPQNTYTDVNRLVPQTNPVVLDTSGRATMYLSPAAYTFIVTDSVGNVQPIQLNPYEDIGQVLFSTLNPASPPTIVTVTSGYTQLVTDQVILCNSTGGANPFILNLMPAASMTQPQVVIKNLGNVVIHVTPNGTDTLELVAGPYTIPTGGAPTLPSIVIFSDQSANWYISAGDGIG